MRHSLIPALILSLLAGCAMPRIGPYHIDVQQGNALDQENVARLKTGLIVRRSVFCSVRRWSSIRSAPIAGIMSICTTRRGN